MHKQPNHYAFALNGLFLNEQAATDNACEVTQVECVVRFGWCGQKIFDGFLVHLKRTTTKKEQNPQNSNITYITIINLKCLLKFYFSKKNILHVINLNNV